MISGSDWNKMGAYVNAASKAMEDQADYDERHELDEDYDGYDVASDAYPVPDYPELDGLGLDSHCGVATDKAGAWATCPTLDHVRALSRGGWHVSSNAVLACRSCNSSKGTKLVGEWAPLLNETLTP